MTDPFGSGESPSNSAVVARSVNVSGVGSVSTSMRACSSISSSSWKASGVSSVWMFQLSALRLTSVMEVELV